MELARPGSHLVRIYKYCSTAIHAGYNEHSNIIAYGDGNFHNAGKDVLFPSHF